MSDNRIDNKVFDFLSEPQDKTSVNLFGPKPTSPGLEDIHNMLMGAGMTPGPVGFTSDIIDAGLYALEGKWKDTGYSLIGAIPIIGQFSSMKSIEKITKSIEATAKLKRIAKFERMGRSIDDGSLLFANKSWQKSIDEGKMWIEESGDMYGKAGKNAAMKTGNVHEIPKYERYSDYYELMTDLSKDMKTSLKKLTPEELSFSKEMSKSPTMKKNLMDLVLRLEKLLPPGN